MSRGHRNTTGQKEKYPIVTSNEELVDETFVGPLGYRNSNVQLITNNIITASGIASGGVQINGAGGNVTLPSTLSILQALSQHSNALVPLTSTTGLSAPGSTVPTTQRLLTTFFLYNNSASAITLVAGDGNTTIGAPGVVVPTGSFTEVGIEPTQLTNGGTQPGQITVYPLPVQAWLPRWPRLVTSAKTNSG